MGKLLISKYLKASVFASGLAMATVALAQVPTVNVLPVQNVVSTPSAVLPVQAKPGNTVDVSVPVPWKCGVNSFTMLNDCGIGAFKNARIQCHDGYEQTLGDGDSCKSSETWAQYAKEVCANRCGIIKGPSVATKPLFPVGPKPIPVCYISDKLTKEYNELILELQKAESAGDKAMAEEIIKKIIALKEEIAKNQKECVNAVPVKPFQQPTEVPKPTLIGKPIAINVDRCNEVAQWENKIAYYKKLSGLSDADLKKENGFSREEIEKILKELAEGLEKVRAQCKLQSETAITITRPIPVTGSAGGGGGASISGQTAIAQELIKPVAAESGQEISTYYRARLEKVSATANTDAQVKELKILKGEIDQLLSNLIKSRKEIEASEFKNLVTEVRVSGGEIKADNVSVQSIGKKILVDVAKKSLTIEQPSARQVTIKDGSTSVEAKEVTIQNGLLKVGANEVKVLPSEAVEKLKISPKGIELKNEGDKAVYAIRANESRKLFGFIPFNVTRTTTVDAGDGNLLRESLPWYSFMTTR